MARFSKRYVPTDKCKEALVKYKTAFHVWIDANRDVLCKIGGTKLVPSKGQQPRYHNATQYNPQFFDRSNAFVFDGILIDTRLAGWIELQLIEYAFELGIGINANHGQSGGNMATLPGEAYSSANPGCIYIVPVHSDIKTPEEFKAVHESDYVTTQKRKTGGTFVKFDPATRKKSSPETKKRKKRDETKKRKKRSPETTKRKKRSDADRYKNKTNKEISYPKNRKSRGF